jgi:translocation and assembly module TamB
VEQRDVGFDVSGTLQSPIVTLVSNPSMDQSEILSWLLFGRGAGAGSGASTALLASSIQTTLGREEKESFLQRMLGQMGMSGVNVDSDLASGGVGVSTQLTPRLLIKYRVDVWEQTNRLILRYHLNQHWALEGISGNEGGADILYEREH